MDTMDTVHLYEFAVIRYLPRVEREEFINIGITSDPDATFSRLVDDFL